MFYLYPMDDRGCVMTSPRLVIDNVATPETRESILQSRLAFVGVGLECASKMLGNGQSGAAQKMLDEMHEMIEKTLERKV